MKERYKENCKVQIFLKTRSYSASVSQVTRAMLGMFIATGVTITML